MLEKLDQLTGKSTQSKKGRISPLLIVLSLVSIFAITLFFILKPGILQSDDSDPNKNSIKNTIAVQKGDIRLRVSTSGIIRPINQVKVSPKYTGLLKKLCVEQGDLVKKGDLLAVMDDSNILGQVQAAQAAYQLACAQYEKAIHGNRKEEIAESKAQMDKAQSMVMHAEQNLIRTKAQLEAVRAQLLRDETNERRLTDLARQGAISDQERLNAVTQAEVTRSQMKQTQQDSNQALSVLLQAKAELESAKQHYNLMLSGSRDEDIKASQQAKEQAAGNLQFLKSQLNDTRIKAPFDGVISQKYADEGAIVTPTAASVTNSATSSSILALAGQLELIGNVSENDIDKISVGQEVIITANAYPDKVFHGHVRLVAPEAVVNQNVTTFEVHAAIDDDPEHKLMSGMNVNAEFLSGKRNNALLIPTVSVVSQHGKTGVLVADKDGKAMFKAVKIGPTSDTSTVVESGLNEGELIFVGLSKEELIKQGYFANSKALGAMFGGGKGKAPIPRSFGR